MRKKLSGVFALFSLLQVMLYLVFILAISAGYLYLVTKNLPISLAVGLLGSVFAFGYSIYLPRRLERKQFLLKELQKYATTMTFYMQSGYNVLNSLESSKEGLDKEVQNDIQKTIDQLQKSAELDTSHFRKYKFPAIDIFHQILKIKYEVGGDAKELFTRVNQSVNFEIVKRDELYRKKKYMRNRVVMMMAMVISMPLIFVFMASSLYEQFLAMGFVAIGLNVLLFIMLLISLLFLQRAATDISILE